MSISVIVATYGDPEWEVTAGTRAIPSLVGQWAEGIYEVHLGNGTISASRNEGAKMAGADWLCFLDADDELAPGYIKAMENVIEQDKPRTLYTPAVQIVRQGRTPGPPHFFREVPLRQANWLVIGTLIHRDLFWEVGGFPEAEHGLEDWGLWSKCARVGAEVVKVPDAVYRYWSSPQSMHHQLWRDKKKQRAAHARVAGELDAWESKLKVFDPGSYDNAVTMMGREQRARGGR